MKLVNTLKLENTILTSQVEVQTTEWCYTSCPRPNFLQSVPGRSRHIYCESCCCYEHIKLFESALIRCRFLSRVSILLLTRDTDIAILSVCPSVCLSVTRWYCMKMA